MAVRKSSVESGHTGLAAAKCTLENTRTALQIKYPVSRVEFFAVPCRHTSMKDIKMLRNLYLQDLRIAVVKTASEVIVCFLSVFVQLVFAREAVGMTVTIFLRTIKFLALCMFSSCVTFQVGFSGEVYVASWLRTGMTFDVLFAVSF